MNNEKNDTEFVGKDGVLLTYRNVTCPVHGEHLIYIPVGQCERMDEAFGVLVRAGICTAGIGATCSAPASLPGDTGEMDSGHDGCGKPAQWLWGITQIDGEVLPHWLCADHIAMWEDCEVGG